MTINAEYMMEINFIGWCFKILSRWRERSASTHVSV